ncbi:hypothetical protein [Nostoc sp.]
MGHAEESPMPNARSRRAVSPAHVLASDEMGDWLCRWAIPLHPQWVGVYRQLSIKEQDL